MIDLIKDREKLLELYRPGTEDFSLVDVPELPFAVIDGEETPDVGAGKAIKALFQAIQPIRRQARERLGKSFVEPPVEMIYWADDPRDFVAGRRERWKWRVMVTLPAEIDARAFAESLAQAKGHIEAMPPSLRLERIAEGLCAQIMHVGKTGDIPALLERLYGRFLPELGYRPSGAYHEIYLDDWSRVAPERRKMILRQPIQPLAKTQRRSS